MRFVVLMAETDHYARWAGSTEDERRAALARLDAFGAAVAERGAVLGGAGLAEPQQARTLRPADRPGGARAVVEGPYAETVEQLGGLWIVDLPDLATALELAALLPPAWSVEVRPTTEE